MSEKSGCAVSVGIVRIADLEFAVNADIFADIIEVLARALNLLSEEGRAARIASFLDQDQGPGVR